MMNLSSFESLQRVLELHRPAMLDPSSPEHRAAVAVVLRPARPAPGLEVLLIRRATKEGDPWSGHMAFPGGRAEPDDRDLLATAVRETREEVGLDLAGASRVLGRLSDIPAMSRGTPTGMVITPFVFAVTSDAATHELRGDPAEVERLVWAPLGPLARGEADTVMPYRHGSTNLELPAYRVGDGDIVWGLTYLMLRGFFAVVG
jgi:8-oxo-dGTP pyrophosphatase MutT (NUDIX family)